LTNNIISLDDFRKQKTSIEDIEDDCPELEDPVVIGWVTDESGNKSLHIISAVEDKECLWMIDIAQKIVDSKPSEYINENE
jgi:hypothetical protein|tara:strand:- start:83 stop:325 length:243 start_codon:yes stop_codon:yes gene_type:complete